MNGIDAFTITFFSFISGDNGGALARTISSCGKSAKTREKKSCPSLPLPLKKEQKCCDDSLKAFPIWIETLILKD